MQLKAVWVVVGTRLCDKQPFWWTTQHHPLLLFVTEHAYDIHWCWIPGIYNIPGIYVYEVYKCVHTHILSVRVNHSAASRCTNALCRTKEGTLLLIVSVSSASLSVLSSIKLQYGTWYTTRQMCMYSKPSTIYEYTVVLSLVFRSHTPTWNQWGSSCTLRLIAWLPTGIGGGQTVSYFSGWYWHLTLQLSVSSRLSAFEG